MHRATMHGLLDLWLGLVLCLGLISTTWAHRRWKPLADHVCPSEDPVTHVCYEMTREYTTCMVHALGCDPQYTDKCVLAIHTEIQGCYVYSCQHMCCCEGCVENDQGQCVQESELGDSVCENGGTWYGGRCSCLEGYSGQRCQTQDCGLQCENGGECEIVDGSPTCICPSSLYQGDRCEKACCDGQCMNGGVCRRDGVISRCECPPGFTGHKCDIVDNPSCPLVLDMKTAEECGLTNMYSLTSGCHRDSDCGDGDICCYDGCQGVCTSPAVRTCVCHGVTYHPGDSFVPVDASTGCQTCVCQMNGEVQCTNLTAQSRDCHNSAYPGQINDHCCTVCPDDENTNTIEVPYFTNCPENFVTMETSYNSDVAYLPRLNLTVRSANGHQLPVIYSRTHFYHSHTTDVHKNIYIIPILSDCDNHQMRAKCILKLQVKDPHPPTFTSCPANIYALNDESITWPEPVSSDNVGIYKVRATGDHIRHRKLGVGTYSVSYTVWDFDQNQAICSFLVKVFDKDVEEHSMPSKLKSRLNSRPMSSGTIIGLVTGLLFGLLVLALLVVGARRYVRQTQGGHSHHHNDPTATNTVYTITGNHEGMVRNAHFDGGKFPSLPALPALPEYSPAYNPPSYDEIERYARLGGAAAEGTPIYETLAKHLEDEDEPIYENVTEERNCNHAYVNDTPNMEYMKI